MTAWPRERFGVSAQFFMCGFVFATWVGHIPGVQARLGLNEAELGVALFFMAVGSPLGMALSTRAVRRLGAALTAVIGGIGFSAALPILLVMPGYGWLCAALLANGATNSLMNIAMNACAVAAERATGRPMMSSFHGFFSLGGLAGASLAAAALRLGAPPLGHAALIAAVSIAALAAALRVTRHLAVQAQGPAAGPRPWNTRLAGVGALLFCCLLTEGAMADWTAVFLVGAGATQAHGALG